MIQVAPTSVEGQREFHEAPFPLVLRCETPDADITAVRQGVAAHRADIETQLVRHGAILFRGFPLQTAEDFDAFVAVGDILCVLDDTELITTDELNRKVLGHLQELDDQDIA